VSDKPLVGLVTPSGEAAVPSEAELYPDVRFITAGLGLRQLTPAGYDAVIDQIVERAESLAEQGAEAIGVSGTSLTFYRGYAFHEQLKESVHAATGLPVTTMSTGVVEGLRAFGVKRVAVGTAYIDEVNSRLRQFLSDSGFEVDTLEGLGLSNFGDPGKVTEADIQALCERVCAEAEDAKGSPPDGLLISCGGLRTVELTPALEAACGVPVVSSRPAFMWSVVRMVSRAAPVAGYGRLLALGAEAAAGG
jgi:arylmalonate decarboxylase